MRAAFGRLQAGWWQTSHTMWMTYQMGKLGMDGLPDLTPRDLDPMTPESDEEDGD